MASEKLEELRRRAAEREAAREAELDVLEEEYNELTEKYIAAGKRSGVDFAVITTLVGNFVVRNPDYLVAKKFADADTKSVEDVIQFVAPCVLYPEQMIARGIFTEHAGVAWALAPELLALHAAGASKKRGK